MGLSQPDRLFRLNEIAIRQHRYFLSLHAELETLCPKWRTIKQCLEASEL